MSPLGHHAQGFAVFLGCCLFTVFFVPHMEVLLNMSLPNIRPQVAQWSSYIMKYGTHNSSDRSRSEISPGIQLSGDSMNLDARYNLISIKLPVSGAAKPVSGTTTPVPGSAKPITSSAKIFSLAPTPPPPPGLETSPEENSIYAIDRRIQQEQFEMRYVGRRPKVEQIMNMSLSVAQSGALRLSLAPEGMKALNFTHIQQSREAANRAMTLDGLPANYNSSANTKYILFWNKYFPSAGYNFREGHVDFFRHHCPVTNCYATENRTLVPEDRVDAVFYTLTFSRNESPPIAKKYHNAKGAFIVGEAPQKWPSDARRGSLDDTFHYALSDRLDSDSPRVYGSVIPLNETENLQASKINSHNIAAGKTKMAAWFVSNCKSTTSNRRKLSDELQLHGVAVDVYGHCGTLSCPRQQSQACDQLLKKDYKFYFAFENCLCNHYVTEKFFRALKWNVIPVTYGLGHELTGAPKQAYIDVFDFPDIKSLAEHLLYLNSNDTAYNEYFRWKQHYKVTDQFGTHHSHCKLCSDLHRGLVPTERYRISKWVEGQCITVNANQRLRDFLRLG